MKAGKMPTYKYRANKTGLPDVRSYSFVRARLFNSTYFRAKEPGFEGNYISICVDTPSNNVGTLVFTNRNALLSENIDSKFIFMDVLDVKHLSYLDYIQVNFEANTINVICFKKKNLEADGEIVNRFTFKITDTVIIPKLITFKINIVKSVFTTGDSFFIRPRIQTHKLTRTTVQLMDGVVSGWDLSVRSSVMSRAKSDGWVEMMVRGADKQDSGRPNTETVMETFGDTFLKGGSGFPEHPMAESTGVIRSVIFINYSERYDGSMGETGIMYEWEGESANFGRWVKLHE